MRLPLRFAAATYLLFMLFMIWMVTIDERYSSGQEDYSNNGKRYSKPNVVDVDRNVHNSSFERLKHDYTGPGATGTRLKFDWSWFNDNERKKIGDFYKEHGYNGYINDIVPLDRKIKDPRPQICKNIQYPSSLPQISIVIPFRNEVLSALLRTVYSILGNTPENLLKEIILVDDGSNIDNLKAVLDIHVNSLQKVSVMRMNTTVGLMMARQAGIDKTTSEYFASMDSHMEVVEGWLEPLLVRLLENPKALLCSRMGVINRDDFSVWWEGFKKPSGFPFFTWNLEQTLGVYRLEFLAGIKSLTDPIPYPTVQGMMIVMKKSWFLQLGGFDPGMKLWGTEQMELSIKVWTCGGVVEMIPCSYAAHLYRERVIWPFKDEGMINKIRFSEVWMDEYKTLFQRYNRHWKLDAGDLKDRKRIRRENNCKPFQFYVDEMQKIAYIYTAKNLQYLGTLYNHQFKACLDIGKFHSNEPGLKKCNAWNEQIFELNSNAGLHCYNKVLVLDSEGKLIMKTWQDSQEITKDKWDYKNQTLIHRPTGKCLCGQQDGKVTLESCKTANNQMWRWKELKGS